MMKQRRIHFCGKSMRIIGIPAILALLGLTGAARADMAFQVKILPKAPNAFEIRVKNETREPISGITFSIGSATSKFLKLEQVDPGGRILDPSADPGDVGLVRDVWTGVGGESIASLSNFTSGFTTTPNIRELMTGLFESPRDVYDNYGQRIQGYFRPSVSGNYTFWITSDDASELRVDGVLVAHVTGGWTHWDNWTQVASQKSAPIPMTVGNSYLVTALQKEGGGGDYVRVGITLPNGVDERPVKASRFSTVSGTNVVPRPPPVTNDVPSDVIRITEINGSTGVTLGNELVIRGVFEQESGNAARIMWNNGSQPNAKITVFGMNGSRSELELPDTADNRSEITYTFLSEARPRMLRVNSRTSSSQPGLFVSNFVVTVRSRDGAVIEARSNNTTDVEIDYLTDGDQVDVRAVEGVYLNSAGQFLYDSTSIPAEQSQSPTNAPRQRYVATGISVNNTPQTGDPTQYSFDMNGDVTVQLRWRHDFALLVNHDFSRTSSDEITPSGSPWAGPLSSEASGNPTPQATTINWIEKGAEVLAQIDGSLLDFTRPGLDIRYVPTGYRAEGSARGVYTENTTYEGVFAVGQQPPQRQQVNSFVMDGWGSITYRWQIQYGVRVNVDDAARAALPRVFQVNELGQNIEIGSLEGVFWFNPNTQVKIASAANSGGLGSAALSGWISGDGYYFSSDGDIQSSDGSLLTGGPYQDANGPVALWEPVITTMDGRLYRGLYVPQLRRPARVLWLYGAQVYLNTARIGEYMFQTNQQLLDDNPGLREVIRNPPSTTAKLSVAGINQNVAAGDMAVWDPNGQKLYPVVPGEFRATWNLDGGGSVIVVVTALAPDTPHYTHIAGTPTVQLTPDPQGTFKFKEMKYTESEAAISEGSLFSAQKPGRSVLLFGEVARIGRGEPKEYLRVRMVSTKLWNDGAPPAGTAIIGRKITDATYDRAKLGTGHILFENARYNADVYDFDVLPGLRAADVYDTALLNSIAKQKVLLSLPHLPGPVIPVNLHPGATPEQRIVVVWYNDPALNDMIMWPYAARTYLPRWPVNESEGLGRIVIASRYGSESLSEAQTDQGVAPAGTNIVADGQGRLITNIFAATTTFDPSRLQQAAVYAQPDRSAAGYNPNEEHGLMAPSLRYAQVSPRPNAAYALRNNDLNICSAGSTGESGQTAEYTSHPFVLVQYFDTAINEFAMRVYRVVKEDNNIAGYRFANQSLITVPGGSFQVSSSPIRLAQEPYTLMEAGEPVIPFYPLGVVIGATPAPESFGRNIKWQSTYWEDHKGTAWAVSGGSNAWFTYSTYYPMQSSFWWPPNKSGRIRYDAVTEAKRAAYPFTGDFVSFMPPGISDLLNTPVGSLVSGPTMTNSQPTLILYKSDWPDVAPVLKAGETLTYSGGEYASDHPNTRFVDANGDVQTVPTPGLPGVLGFAVGEVVFDALNPFGINSQLTNSWTVRMGQVLEVRSVPLSIGDFPSVLLPANGRTRVSGGKYVFNDLPASLQKRLRYDPLAQSVDPVTGVTISGRLEFSGLVNDKNIAADDLTAAPPAVYVLEPNIMTRADRDALLNLVEDGPVRWIEAVSDLYEKSRNPTGLKNQTGGLLTGQYLVGLQPEVQRDPVSGEPFMVPIEEGSDVLVPLAYDYLVEAARQFGPGLALIPNGAFLDPYATIPVPGGSPMPVPDVSWVTVAENNDPSMGGSPVTLHVIKVDRRERYRGAIKTVFSDNVFDENVVLRHTAEFGANPEDLVYEWWYRPDDGALNVMPPFVKDPNSAGDWKLFPDLSGQRGLGRTEVLLKGNPNAPEALLADTWWFGRYRHKNDVARDTDWERPQPNGETGVNFDWFGAGNNDPFNDFDLDGFPDYRAQLAMGWLKRVLDAVNPYEARIRDFEGDPPSTVTSMLQLFGPRYEGPVALNPDKNVVENVGLIELYETILNRAANLSINLSTPVSTPAIANALELASTRISDFYAFLGNEAYTDAKDTTIGAGGAGWLELASLLPALFSFQNMVSSPIEEELALLRGQDDDLARPVYNRLFWNFTKAEGEMAYVQNYRITDINQDGFIDEDDAMKLYPQGHGDAWGHYLTALCKQYDLLRHPYFNWVSRSEFYNLMDVVMKVDFLDERKFAQIAAAKAEAGTEIMEATYRDNYVADPKAQWQGYTDVNKDRAWGVQDWARRAAQGAYFDWITANALLPSKHPNEHLEGIQKVDRTVNDDIKVVSANLTMIQQIFDDANSGLNPLRLAPGAVPFDLDPTAVGGGSGHFEQIYNRAVSALDNAVTALDNASLIQNRLRQVAATEADFRNEVFQQDLAYRNDLIQIFGRPYDGTVGAGKLYPAGYDGPDLALYMYVQVREINQSTVPGPSLSYATFDSNGQLNGGDLYNALFGGNAEFMNTPQSMRSLFAATFAPDSSGSTPALARDGSYSVNYMDIDNPKVSLGQFSQLMPVQASGYTFQAPVAWGSRPAVGELQMIINEMMQQEAEVAIAVDEYDSLTGEIIRQLRLVNSQLATSGEIYSRNRDFGIAKAVLQNVIKGAIGVYETLKEAEDIVQTTFQAASGSVPVNLPTAGLSFSPGDALAPVRGGLTVASIAVQGGIGAGEIVAKLLALSTEIAFDAAETGVNLANEAAEYTQAKRELLKSVEDLVGDEAIKRVAIFKEIEALRGLSDRYRSTVAKGSRLIDERAAFNRRVASMTQLNRYQDMAFRVHRNHALQNYNTLFDVAARYVYLAARAYDYEMNFDESDPASPSDLYADIIKARNIGGMANGVPQYGQGGLAGALAQLKINYDAFKGQLGINNPQLETGKMSLRTELCRILPAGQTNVQPVGNSQFPGGGTSSDELWRKTLENARVDNLWDIPEYRYYARPFASDIDADGNATAEPGLVFRFGTSIIAGQNAFGLPLSGGDHAFDPSLYVTKIKGVGVWFSGYLSDDVLNALPQSPRVYLIPVGADVMGIPNSLAPNRWREWNVVDQIIPVPIPALGATLDQSRYIPLLDSLNDRIGSPRRFPSFRAYHDGGAAINMEELVLNTRLVGRSVWNTEWMLIIPGLTLNADPNEGLDRFIRQITDIKLIFQTYSHSGN
jgi:hypothetical protein